MSNNTHYFHFTLGPVQGFVSQARRTRDFWAGSFILSWLAAVAIKAVEYQKGEIQFPHADENYMAWLVGEGKKGTEPKQGSIPNRFKSLVAAIDPNTFNPDAVVEAVQEAWQALADKVWEEDLGLPSDSPAVTIWERQIPNFWDMSWVITQDKNDSSALDKRKNWRSYTPPNEPGVKCAMMDGWQELSGELSPSRKAMEVFWKAIRDNGKQGMKSDLRKHEALCAMALVKRRFSRHFAKLDHKMKQGWHLKGWKVQSTVPSVTYMAAVHWLEQVLQKAQPDVLHTFHDAAAKLTGEGYGEWDSNIHCLEQLSQSREFKHLRSLDGNVFFKNMLENKRVFEDEKQAQAETVRKALQAVNDSAKIEPVSPFYAILLMDGDSLGSQMGDPNPDKQEAKQQAITNGLAEFTRNVPKTVYEHNGFLVYAGGDDVLAILPLEDALPCAAALRKLYMNCFKGKPVVMTLSGAIEFAHIKTPLTSVLKDAHHLLDEIAKDGRGRDALAIRVWKPGGLQVEWAQPWKIALNAEGKVELVVMADTFQKNIEKDSDFSSKFFYKVRERFELLNPTKDKEGKYTASILNPKQAVDLMTMEYINSWGSSKNKDVTQANNLVEKLLKQCRPIKRDLNQSDPEQWQPIHGKGIDLWEADGALLVRFLAHKGVER